MEIARICRRGLVVVLLAAKSPSAFGQDVRVTAPAAAGAGSQSCGNIGKMPTTCCKCPGFVRGAQTCGPTDCNKGCNPNSPFGVDLSMSQGYLTIDDSGSDGLGATSGGCSRCGSGGGGGSIPAGSQMMRFHLLRLWRSTWTHDGNLGRSMYTGYDYYVTFSSSLIEIRDPNTGYIEQFVNSGGSYIPAPGILYRSLVTAVSGTSLTITQPGGLRLQFDITGYLTGSGDKRCRLNNIQDLNGNKIQFNYALPATNTTANVLMWTTAVDPYGRTTTFTYTTFIGLNVLSLVTFADSRTVQYNYTSDNTQFPHTVQYGVSGTPSGIQSTWYATTSMMVNEAMLPADHYYWQVTPSDAAFGRIRAFQRFDGNYVFASSVTTTAGITTATTWDKNVVQQVVRSPTQLLISSRRQLLDGTWESNINYTTGGDYLPPTQYVEPADTGVPARTTSVVRDSATDMVTERTYADSTSESYAYNSFNEMTSFTDRGGHQQTWTYDANGNMTDHTVAVGTAVTAHEDWTYNTQGQVLTYVDFNGNTTSYSYYPAGASQYELKQITLPSGTGQPAGTIVFTYDGFGRVLTVTDPVSRTVTYGYDAAGRHILTTYPDTSTEATNYGTGDNSARVLNTTDRNGNQTVFSYDGTGRIVQTQVQQAISGTVLTTTTQTYDPTTGLLTSTNTDGDSTEYTYDYLDRALTTTVHPSATVALSTQNVYNRYRLLNTLDYYNRSTSYTYDTMDRVLSTTVELTAGGATIGTSSTYYPIGLVETSHDANGKETDYFYDARNRPTTTTVAVGTAVAASTTLAYDANSNVVTRTDERSHNWVSTYTCRNQVLTSVDPLTDTSSYTYTADTMVATVTNANSHTTTNAYYACCARLQSVTDPDSNVKTFVYDFNGNQTQVTDESGRVTTYAYDGLNRQTNVTVDPGAGHLNLVTSTTYNPTPGVIGTSSTTTNPAGQAITTYLDGLGRVSSITGNTATVSYTYDVVIATGPNAGLVQTTVQTDPAGINLTTSSISDGAGRTIQTLDGFGHPTSFTYDSNGNTLTSTDRDGKVTTNTYDQRNRALTTEGDTGGIAATTSFVYDPTNNLIQVTDADSKVTVYTYDNANRRLTTTYASGTADASTWTATYKPLGQVATLTKPAGGGTSIVITYSYEDRELLSQRLYTQGMTTLGTDTFTYHPNRLLKTANGGLYTTLVDRSVLNTSYDMANRLIQEQENIGPGLKTLSYQYTPDSLLSQTTYPGGTVASRTYTAHRQLYQTLIGGTAQATFSYDTADRRSQRTYVNGVQTNWTLDANGRVTDLKHATTGITPTTLQEWTYGYTNADDPLSQADVTTGFTVHGQAYQYDGLHQIDAFQRGVVSSNTVPSPVASQAWTLSKAGDWTSWATTVGMTTTTDTRTHNNIHALTARSAPASVQTYDANFNQTGDGVNYTFVYDANNQLKQATNTGTATVTTYRYDALGRRVEKNLGSGATVTQYYYAGQQIVEEHDDTGGVDTLNAFYTYGDYVDEPLTMDRPSGTRYYYHANRLYSTYLLTDSTGAIAERYTYTPYGATTTYDSTYTTPQTTSRVGNPYLFTGRELDGETLLYFYRARTYDPVQGRFKQLDPVGYSGGFNLYRYCRNNPTVLADPSGLGCMVTFKCQLTTQQDVTIQKDPRKPPEKVGVDCFYKCTDTSRHTSAGAVGTQTSLPIDCDALRKIPDGQFILYQSKRATDTTSWVGSWFYDPCYVCDKVFEDAKDYTVIGEVPTKSDCSQSECRKMCDTGGAAVEILCDTLKNSSAKKICNAMGKLGGAVCRDWCDSTCSRP